jgi:hypothetical protein
MLWTIWSIPPDEVVRQLSAGIAQAPQEDHGEIREDGFHRTDTIDYVFVMMGLA